MKKRWHIVRTLGFIVIGLLNTVFIKVEDIGTWKNYTGYVILVIGLVDLILLVKKGLLKGN